MLRKDQDMLRPFDEVIGLVGLQEAVERRVRALSGEQRRRLGVGLTLVDDPPTAFLDEPTTDGRKMRPR